MSATTANNNNTTDTSITNNFINALNEALVALNKSTGHTYFQPIQSLADLRDGRLLATIVERFETVCGRKRRVRDRRYYQFVEDWLVTIGNVSHVPNYGQFARNILVGGDPQLVANLFAIVAITMYNQQHEMWQPFNVDIFFLLMGEPMIPKINRLLNKTNSMGAGSGGGGGNCADEKYAIAVQNRELEIRCRELADRLTAMKLYYETEARDRQLEADSRLELANGQLRERDERIVRLEQSLAELTKTVGQLKDETSGKTMKIDALRDLINGTDNKTLVSVDELVALKHKVQSMQSQMKQISTEMESKFNIVDTTDDDDGIIGDGIKSAAAADDDDNTSTQPANNSKGWAKVKANQVIS